MAEKKPQVLRFNFSMDSTDMCQVCWIRKATKQLEKVESRSVTSITPVCDEHGQRDPFDLFTTIRKYVPWEKSKNKQ